MSDADNTAPNQDQPEAQAPTPTPAPVPAPAPAPAPAAAEPAPVTSMTPRSTARPKCDPQGWQLATGRRKTAVARVRIRPGDGEIKIRVSMKKTKKIEEYFSEIRDRNDVVAPLKATDTFGKMDIICRVHGGGYMGQAQAIRLGIARALKGYDPQLEGVLRDRGYLTRDPREVERKKYGQRGARRKFQFSKR